MSTANPEWVDDFMDLADAVGVTTPPSAPAQPHPWMQERIDQLAAEDVLLTWSQAAAGVDLLDELAENTPIPFTVVLDHAACEGLGCDRVICKCATGLCSGTTVQACPHHELLCDECRLHCPDCRIDYADDGGA